MHLAWWILKSQSQKDPIDLSEHITVPASWHIASGFVLRICRRKRFFPFFNPKHKDSDTICAEYPDYCVCYDNANLPAHMIKRLGQILDSTGNGPLIVRSSSLLEDNFGTSFAGKYESHFYANRGSRKTRLAELYHAVRLVCASAQNPDALVYRKQMELANYDERMAVLVQQVMGARHGKLFFYQLRESASVTIHFGGHRKSIAVEDFFVSSED